MQAPLSWLTRHALSPTLGHQGPFGSQPGQYVTAEFIERTRQIPALRAVRQVFGIQRFGQCIPHTEAMLHSPCGELEAAGLVSRPKPSLVGRLVTELLIPHDTRRLPLAVERTGRGIHGANSRCGPLQLLTLSTLQTGQGRETYGEFHATLLVASWEHKGRHLGVLADGNDLQSNPVMLALREWQRAAGDTRSLDQLKHVDFEAFNRAHPHLDIQQAALRIVDLDEMNFAINAEPARVEGFRGG